MEDLRHPPEPLSVRGWRSEEAAVNSTAVTTHMLVEIHHRICTDHVLVEVEDQGAGFDPLQIRDATAPENLEHPGGRGCF